MKAHLSRNHMVVGAFRGYRLSLLADWLFIFAVPVTLGVLAILWYQAQREQAIKELRVGPWIITLDGSE